MIYSSIWTWIMLSVMEAWQGRHKFNPLKYPAKPFLDAHSNEIIGFFCLVFYGCRLPSTLLRHWHAKTPHPNGILLPWDYNYTIYQPFDECQQQLENFNALPISLNCTLFFWLKVLPLGSEMAQKGFAMLWACYTLLYSQCLKPWHLVGGCGPPITILILHIQVPSPPLRWGCFEEALGCKRAPVQRMHLFLFGRNLLLESMRFHLICG